MSDEHRYRFEPDLMTKHDSDIRRLQDDIKDNKQALRELEDKLEEQDKSNYENLVTQTEFKPIKQIVYGMVAIILIAVITGIVELVVMGGKK